MLSFGFAYGFILISCVVGFLYGVFNWFSVMSIELKNKELSDVEKPMLDEKEKSNAKHREEQETIKSLTSPQRKHSTSTNPFSVSLENMKKISGYIQNGANAFLIEEYCYLLIFIIIFGIVILAIDQFRFWTTIAFVVGASTSTLSGYIGMYVATRTNVRVTYMAATEKQGNKLSEAFKVAFKGGCVMGFCLVSLALFVFTILVWVYFSLINPVERESYLHLFEYLAGYGLGGSTVALFCRVGGGIYTKAADVGADLVGKVVAGFNEDSIDNPATIADNVGDNVGDIAGMGSDLFGSFAESTCAALVISGTSVELVSDATFLYPLVLSAAGILVCIVTAVFATHIMTVDEEKKIESTLKWQLYISSGLLTPVICIITMYVLPSDFTFIIGENGATVVNSKNWGVMVCVLLGLWSGMIIGYFTDYYTSNAYAPVIKLAESCKSGAAINIIRGLALGYLSTIIPIICIAITIFVSFKFAGMYGIALAALGMLNNLAIGLAIDAYGPISDNAGGITEMSLLPHEIRNLTDQLDAAGNTTAAIGKGFAIGSACLVSLALFGAFVTRAKMTYVNILEPIQFACLIIGAMMPYAFSALTMASVGEAAEDMCNEVKRQIDAGENSFIKCIEISTKASLKEMIVPGVMVIFTPLVLGTLFGPGAVSGYLAGVIVSGVQMAISSSNSGGAWDNCKKYIEAGKLRILKTDILNTEDKDKVKEFFVKKTTPHTAAVVGDTVGDPLKDTSGPSINILIKLSAIVSLIFGTFFMEYSIFKLD